jgi:transposase
MQDGDHPRQSETRRGAVTRALANAAQDCCGNAAERQLRAVAVGRKNWLFAGSDNGGERAYVLYSLPATCKLYAVNPFDYLRDVLGARRTTPRQRRARLQPQSLEHAREDLDASNDSSTAVG